MTMGAKYKQWINETLILLYANNKSADQTAHMRSLISAIVFRFQVKTMAKLGSRRVSMFQLVSVAKQARMSFTQKTGFSRRDIFPVEDAFSGQ